MAVGPLILSPSSLLTCPCSSGTTRMSFALPAAKNYACQHFRGAARIRRRELRTSTLNLGTEFFDSFGRRRLTRSAGSQIESSNRLNRKNAAGVARAGLPVVSSIPVLGPVANAVFNPVVLMIIYLAGASRFWSGFSRTTYTSSTPTKVALAALWPALYVASKAYRANFKKAVL